MSEEFIKDQLKKWIRDESNADIFYLMWSEEQVQSQQLCDSPIFVLKKQKRLPDFKKWAQNFFKLQSIQKLRKQGNNSEEEKEAPQQKMQAHIEAPTQNLLRSFQQKYSTLMERLSGENRENNQILISTLYQQIQQLFTQITDQRYITHKKSLEENTKEGKIDKLKIIIKQVLEIYGKSKEDIIFQRIINYGNLEVLRNYKYFENQEFRQNFKEILQLSTSFKEIKKYGGKDLTLITEQLQLRLEKCLIDLKISPTIISEILKQIISNPLSNLIASHQNLTHSQKIIYYSSQFYNSPQLINYINAKSYPETLHAKALADIVGLIQQIAAADCKITNQIMRCILQFNFIELLIAIQNKKKKNIYKAVTQKYISFYQAYQLIHLKEKKEIDLRNDQKNQKIMNLRKVFLKVGLRFQDWDRVEHNLMSRKQQTISNLQLSINNKHQIRSYYSTQLQPYFHSKQKSLSFKQEVEQSLLKDMMNKEIGKKDMEYLIKYIKQIIQTFEIGELENQISKQENTQLTGILNKNQKFQEYKRNKGVDISEEQYQVQQKLKQLIYQINLKNLIEVPHESVLELIQYIAKNKYLIPTIYSKFVCELQELRAIKNKNQLGGVVQSIFLVRNEEFFQMQQVENRLNLSINSQHNSFQLNQSKSSAKIKQQTTSPQKNREEVNSYKESPLKKGMLSSRKLEQAPQESPNKKENKKFNEQKLKQLLAQFHNLLKQQVQKQPKEKSIILGIIDKKFKENPLLVIEEVLKANPFENPQASKMYDDFFKPKQWISGLQKNSLKKQINKISEIFGKRYAIEYAKIKQQN